MDVPSSMLVLILVCLPPSVLILRRKLRRLSSATTGFKSNLLIGNFLEFCKNRHRFLDWTADVLRACRTHTAKYSRPGRPTFVLTALPKNIEHILKTNFSNYPKGTWSREPFIDFSGDGIFNADGELWKKQREIAVHEFTTRSLKKFILETVEDEIRSRLIPNLKKASTSRRTIDLQDILERFALDNICKVSFNVDPAALSLDDANSDVQEFITAFNEAATLSYMRNLYFLPILWRIQRFLNVGRERRLKQKIREVHVFADEIVSRRKHSPTAGEDLLSRFMAIDWIPDKLLRDIVVSFIIAGKDTTSSVLAWFFFLLSKNSTVEGKILEELHAIRNRHGSKPGDVCTFDEIREMNYLQAALSETLRLHPPVPLTQKECLNDDILPDGTIVKKGWTISFHAYAMGRIESIWGEDCREFRPERWIDDGGTYRHESPFKFPAFNAGPRICLGKEMAYIQMKLVAIAVLENFQIEMMNKDIVAIHSSVHRIRGGLHVVLEERISKPSVRTADFGDR